MTASCPPRPIFEHYELVDSGTTGTGYARQSDGVCAALTPSAAQRLYAVGSQISADAFPALERFEYGSGRLRLSFLGSGGKPYLASPSYPDADGWARYFFFDVDLGRGCSPQRFADGKLRCVPVGWSPRLSGGGGLAYTSPSCTGERVAGVSADPILGSCAADPIGFYLEKECEFLVREVYAAGPRFTGTTVYFPEPVSGACNAFTVQDSATERFYPLGKALDPATLFAEIEKVQRN